MKNFYSLNPGEFFVAQEILKRRNDIKLFLPIKDIGADFIAIKSKGALPVSIQVKESRIYPKGYSWHQVKQHKLEDADVFVFISYVPVTKGSKIVFDKDYAVIPKKNLIKLCAKKTASNGKYSFNFAVEGKRLFDVRSGRVDVTAYYRAWRRI